MADIVQFMNIRVGDRVQLHRPWSTLHQQTGTVRKINVDHPWGRATVYFGLEFYHSGFLLPRVSYSELLPVRPRREIFRVSAFQALRAQCRFDCMMRQRELETFRTAIQEGSWDDQ